MKDVNIREALQDKRNGGDAFPPAGPFWADFRARARLVPQIATEKEPRWTRFLGVPEWTAAATCALLLCVGGWFMIGRSADDEQPSNAVRSLRISVPHGAVLMTYDAASKATIVWVDDMAADDEGEA